MVVSFNSNRYWFVIGFSRKQTVTFRLAEIAKKELLLGIRKSAHKNDDRKELLYSLASLLQPYITIKASQDPAFRYAINNVIDKATESYCSIHLNTEEMLFLWHEVR
jgi:hypothetical protein